MALLSLHLEPRFLIVAVFAFTAIMALRSRALELFVTSLLLIVPIRTTMLVHALATLRIKHPILLLTPRLFHTILCLRLIISPLCAYGHASPFLPLFLVRAHSDTFIFLNIKPGPFLFACIVTFASFLVEFEASRALIPTFLVFVEKK